MKSETIMKESIEKCPLRPMVYSCVKFNDIHHMRPVIIVSRDANDVSKMIIQIPIRWMDRRCFALGDGNSNQKDRKSVV